MGITIEEHYILKCGDTIYYYIFIVITASFKIVLHLFGLILAILNRKVKIDALNDYKSMSGIVYSSTILITLIGIVAATTAGRPDLNMMLHTALVFITISTFLGLTFIPKVISKFNSSTITLRIVDGHFVQ